jgi:hypothetical protein
MPGVLGGGSKVNGDGRFTGTALLISMAAALARTLDAPAAAVVQTTAFRRRALQVAVQSAAKRFRRGVISRQLNLAALAGKSLSGYNDSFHENENT